MSTDVTAARYTATGKRKSSVARVTLTPGTGQIMCNGRPIDEFFGRPVLVTQARGIARALTVADEALRTELKKEGFLTRDARIKERKKAGLKGARKRPQFSKR